VINEVITSLGEYSDVRSKAILESTADVPERPTLNAPRYAVESRIELWKTSVYRLPTAASKDQNSSSGNRSIMSEVMMPADPLIEPVLLAVLTPFTVSVTVKVPVESDTPAP
jgi:hypothetical protein